MASDAPGSRFQAPARLPMAFQVQTVSLLTPSICFAWTLIRPLWLVTQTQSSSAIPSSLAFSRLM